jgi:hypothetical protein
MKMYSLSDSTANEIKFSALTLTLNIHFQREDVTDPLAGADKGTNLFDLDWPSVEIRWKTWESRGLSLGSSSFTADVIEDWAGVKRSIDERLTSFKTVPESLLPSFSIQPQNCDAERRKCPDKNKNIMLLH